MKNISVALACYNEETNIVDCIEAAKLLADEIIVVDGHSRDRTAELARQQGAIVVEVPNKKMFHINKNIAIKNCTNEWVFVLDADERITEDLAIEIKKTLRKVSNEKGFWINRKNWFLGGYLTKGGAYPDAVIRLFKNGYGIHPEKDVHEQIAIKGPLGHITSPLLHLADPNFARYLERANRYTDETKRHFKEQKLAKNFPNTIYYVIIKPAITFFKIYVRHKGYVDGFRGFVWALFSSAHYFYAYSKYLTDKK
ncbi:MAG: glycosyltransferase family 2 protein [Patescibacteria group bacterium]